MQKILQEYFCAEPGYKDYKANESRHLFLAYCVMGPLDMLCHSILIICSLRISNQGVSMLST